MRYDGGACFDRLHDEVKQQILAWQGQGLLEELCPEVAGGLGVPRPAAEIQGAKVVTQSGEDVTRAFVRGAQQALAICQQLQIKLALLKQGSPSCGNSLVNDGTFTKTKIEGQGLTAQLLMQHGIRVFNELELPQLCVALRDEVSKKEGVS